MFTFLDFLRNRRNKPTSEGDFAFLWGIVFDLDYHLAQNTGNKKLSIYDLSDVYIQKKKAGNLFLTETVVPGATTMIDVEVSKYDYQDVVKDIEDIKEISIQIEIRDENYNEIDTPTLEIKIK